MAHMIAKKSHTDKINMCVIFLMVWQEQHMSLISPFDVQKVIGVGLL